MHDSYTLQELNHLVRGVVEHALDEEYWVTGEFSEARVGSGGHFYGELVQKDEEGRALVAKARVNCWVRQYNLLRLRFLRETGEEIRTGLKVMVLVRVTFHEVYGFALQMLDVDPNYTLGDMARRRHEILQRLEKEGVLHDNQQLALPLLLNRIAVVSSAHAAGYGDFCNQLQHNEYGLFFETRLFPALMQGAKVEESILQALYAIADEEEEWDAVVIIRGGGATSDLSDFDSYPLAAAVAQFPLPVIVGIGHDRDQTVLDLVAHTSLKTPTAVAAFLVEYQLQQLSQLESLQQRILQAACQRLQYERNRLDRHTSFFPMAFERTKERQEGKLALVQQRLRNALLGRVERGRHQLDLIDQRLQLQNPDLLLKRGYSVTLCGGKIVRDVKEIAEGEIITTRLQRGEIYSKVVAHSADE